MNIFIEAESFKNRGGWVVDTSSMETIHSAYLMAHGLGVPIDDATTDFEVKKEGRYYIYALTRDWTKIWNVKDPETEFAYADDTAKITWGIDIHYPEPVNDEKFGEAFRSFAYHLNTPFACSVPYRCLYSKDIDNLFIGGRLVQVT